MSNKRTIDTAISTTSWWTDFSELVKFRLTLLVIFTSLMSYLITAGSTASLGIAVLLSIGGFFVAGAANALNEVLEKEYDALMVRTRNRPLAAGRMTTSTGVLQSGMMLLIGTVMLSAINPLTGLLGMISVVSYAFVYTPMKRYSTWAVPLGAVPGAMPALIGCVAVNGEITLLAVLLFAIQFMWQFPHFWAIAFLSFDDYERAGYQFLPKDGDRIDQKLGLYALIYTSLLLVLIVPVFAMELTNSLGLVIISGVTIYFLYTAYRFYSSMSRPAARQLMFASFFYLPISFGALVISAF
ncbi:MAG: heme o synthase [Saprospiraceae bacterium]|nr:heme o synthase [Saprospiraceae bacterium]